MPDVKRLEWVDTDDGPRPDCQPCLERMADPCFVAAAHSVAISRRLPGLTVARAALDRYHSAGHRRSH